MNEVLQQLHSLTEVDFSIAQTREQLARYPAMLDKMAAAEAKQQKTITEAEAQLDAARHERRKAEKEVQTLQDQIKKYVSQQSAVKTNKEYQAITHEIDQIRVKIDTWETIGLEKLEIEDECLGRKKAAATQLAALEAEHATERRRIEEQMMEKQERIERLTAERQHRFDAIPEEWKELYELPQHAPPRHGLRPPRRRELRRLPLDARPPDPPARPRRRGTRPLRTLPPLPIRQGVKRMPPAAH